MSPCLFFFFFVKPLHYFRSNMTWRCRIPSSGVIFCDGRGQARQPALQSRWRWLTTPLRHTTLQTTDSETKEAAASFPMWAIWANSWWRLLKITAAHHQRSLARRQRAEKRRRKRNKRKAIEHFSLLADIVVCLFVGCAGGVEECCFQEWIILSTSTTYLFQRHLPH